LPPGARLKFIVEADKMERIRRVVGHNKGIILEEIRLKGGVRVLVEKSNVN
jgi:hypothetical protein